MAVRWRREVGLAVLLALSCLLAYWPALDGGFIWDDAMNVTANTALSEPGGLRRIWTEPDSLPQYFPLTYSLFRLEYRLWGLDPTGYHLVNLALHMANALLVRLVLGRLGFPGAWLGAFIFALHPVQVESVAWISELKNLLSGLFVLLSLLTFPGLASGRRYDDPGPVRGAWILAFAAFVLAMLAKTAAAPLPVVLLFLLWWRRRLDWRRALGLVPFFLAAIGPGMVSWIREQHGVANAAAFTLPLAARLELVGRTAWFYLGKLLWPLDLSFIYERRIPSGSLAGLLPLGVAFLALAALWLLRRPLGRGPLVAALCYAAGLAPFLGFVPFFFTRYAWAADHFQYLPCLAVVAPLAALPLWRGGGAGGPLPRSLLRAGAVLFLPLALGGLTWQRSAVFQGEETLWRATIEANPGAWMAYNNLGLILAGRGSLEEAIGHYREAIRLHPDYPEARNNLGAALGAAGNDDEARRELEQAIRLEPHDASHWLNLGNVFFNKGRLAEAERLYRQALERDPGDALANNNLGVTLVALGRGQEAERYFRKALEANPRYAGAHLGLAGVLQQRGLFEEARRHRLEADLIGR